jgi:hypothetical protein
LGDKEKKIRNKEKKVSDNWKPNLKNRKETAK